MSLFRSLSKSTGKKAASEVGDASQAPPLSSSSGPGSSSSGSLLVPGTIPEGGSSPTAAPAGTIRRNVSISRATGKDQMMAAALTVKSLPPIPAQEELDTMFMEVVERMNVQEADKAKMMAFPAEKKWQLVLDSDQARTMLPPKHYLDLLEHHLKKRKKKKNNQSSKEQAQTEKDLQGMEISLRTNPLSWINEFIDPPNNGYALLSEFMDVIPEDPEFDKERYLSLLCVKAVMNNKYGLNYVLKKAGSIQQLVSMLSLTQEKANILLYNLLAAVCVVGGMEGHSLVLKALDHFAKVHNEKMRFQTLVSKLADERFNFDYKASLVAFITVLVHIPDSIYQRISLQYEFTLLGMDGLVDTLLAANSEVLDVQLHGYLSNFISIPENYQSGTLPMVQKTLPSGASTSVQAPDSIDLAEFRQEKASLQLQVTSLQKELQEKEQAAANRISELQKQLTQMQQTGATIVDSGVGAASVVSINTTSTANLSNPPDASAATAAPPPPPTPGAPPPPPAPGAPPPPPAPGAPPMSGAPGLPPKRKIQPKVPLPTLNWQPIKDPATTVFKDIDDENFHKTYDFSTFEQKFKKNVRETKDAPAVAVEKKKPAKEEIQVVDANRSRNVLLAIRKIDMKNDDLGKAIQNLSTDKLRGEMADILLKCLPTPEEVAALQVHDKQPEKLSEGDRFLLFISKIEHVEVKLKIISFMSSFDENISALEPQLNTVIAAAGSLRSSVKLKKIFEIILAFGNYMNSAKRGGAYGFKLSALDRLNDVKDGESRTLILFLAELISQKYPAYNVFPADLLSLEAASSISLQTMTSDLNDLVAGLKVIEGELKFYKGNKQVEDFYAKATKRVEAAQADFKSMTDLYHQTATYFGEDPKTLETTEFFSYFLRFTRNYQAALKELELLAKQAEKPKPTPGKRVRGSYVGVEKGAVDDVINEIRLKGFRR